LKKKRYVEPPVNPGNPHMIHMGRTSITSLIAEWDTLAPKPPAAEVVEDEENMLDSENAEGQESADPQQDLINKLRHAGYFNREQLAIIKELGLQV
jgi:hypothetical protein